MGRRVSRSKLQPLHARTQTPTESSGVIVLHVHLLVMAYDIEAERSLSVDHGDPSNWDNRDSVPLADDPCGDRYCGSFSNDIRGELVEEERISKEGWSALLCLGIAQLNPFGSVENLIWNWCCPTICIYFSSWYCFPVTYKCDLNLHSHRKKGHEDSELVTSKLWTLQRLILFICKRLELSILIQKAMTHESVPNYLNSLPWICQIKQPILPFMWFILPKRVFDKKKKKKSPYLLKKLF